PPFRWRAASSPPAAARASSLSPPSAPSASRARTLYKWSLPSSRPHPRGHPEIRLTRRRFGTIVRRIEGKISHREERRDDADQGSGSVLRRLEPPRRRLHHDLHGRRLCLRDHRGQGSLRSEEHTSELQSRGQ